MLLICLWNLGISLHHAMFYFSPETSTVQIFHLDVQLPEIKIQSSDRKRIIASIGHDIIDEKINIASGQNTDDSSVLTLNEDILPDFFQKEYHLTGIEQSKITSEDKNDTQSDVLLTHQRLKSLIFFGGYPTSCTSQSFIFYVRTTISQSLFENIYQWRNQLSPSSIAGLGLLLCERLRNGCYKLRIWEHREDVICVLEQRDRLASLAFCMRKELRSLLSVFTKGPNCSTAR